jgi:predicted double-glycine peptidase
MVKKAILILVIILNQIIISTVIQNPRTLTEMHDTPNFPLIEQPDSITCGPTSTTMLLNYYGIEATVTSVKQRTKTHWFTYKGEAIGLTLPTYIQVALVSYGVESQIETGTIRKLKRYVDKGRLPIVLVRSGQKTWHYIVVIGYDQDNIIIADPGWGEKRKIATKTFDDAWSFTGNLEGNYYGSDFYGNILRKVDIMNVADHILIVPKTS